MVGPQLPSHLNHALTDQPNVSHCSSNPTPTDPIVRKFVRSHAENKQFSQGTQGFPNHPRTDHLNTNERRILTGA